MADLARGGVVPPDLTVVSWLPLYHDMAVIALMGAIMPIWRVYPRVDRVGGWYLQRLDG